MARGGGGGGMRGRAPVGAIATVGTSQGRRGWRAQGNVRVLWRESVWGSGHGPMVGPPCGPAVAAAGGACRCCRILEEVLPRGGAAAWFGKFPSFAAKKGASI
jgi:hypothetical protein